MAKNKNKNRQNDKRQNQNTGINPSMTSEPMDTQMSQPGKMENKKDYTGKGKHPGMQG